MSPFDPDYKPQIADPTPFERAAAKTARTLSARRAEELRRTGPAKVPTLEQQRAHRAKTAKILKGGL